MRFTLLIPLLVLPGLSNAQNKSSPTLPDYFKPGVEHPLGVRPDCSETKVPASKLEEIASNEGTNNIIDFLNQSQKDLFKHLPL